MTRVRICGFGDPRTYPLPRTVPEEGLLELTIVRIGALCIAHGGMDRPLYHAGRLEVLTPTEGLLRAKCGAREWRDLMCRENVDHCSVTDDFRLWIRRLVLWIHILYR
jgi:hypothetical protein